MAASVARAEMVLDVFKGSPKLVKDFESESKIKATAKVFARMLCPFSARGAHLVVLKWARVPLGQKKKRACCQKRAPRSPPVGARSRVLLDHTDVRDCCRERLALGTLVRAGQGVPLKQTDV